MFDPSKRDGEKFDSTMPSYLSRLTQCPLLTSEEERVLTRAARAGCHQSRQRLVESNMRLVINIARSYHNKSIPLEDLIQEGAIGLMSAVERFDPDKGFRFSTYATHWVRQSIGRAIDNKAKTIRLPAHISQTLRKIERTRTKLTDELGYEPGLDVVARELGIAPKRLQTILQASQELLSLDMKVGDNEGSTLGALLRDTSSGDPERVIISEELVEELHHMLLELNERERRIVSRRIAAPEDEVQSRDDLSGDLGVSRDRLRQLEIQAIKKLRQVAQLRRLKDYLGD
jgi:RNA polymerase primary sigma factor